MVVDFLFPPTGVIYWESYMFAVAGIFMLIFLLNLTITPLGVVNCYFYFVGACTCTKSAIIYGSGFFYFRP